MAMTAPAVETSEGRVEVEAVAVLAPVEEGAEDLADVTGADVTEVLTPEGTTPVEGTTTVVGTTGGLSGVEGQSLRWSLGRTFR